MEDRQVCDPKRAAARAAADLVQSGMRLGLGTGSTFDFALERIAERIRDEGLEVVGIATSRATEIGAKRLGVPLTTFADVDELDLTIDGADEVDPRKNLIKGGGGALLREKIVAAASRQVVIVIGEDKLVERLGQTFRLPVEVLEFGLSPTSRALNKLALSPALRMAGDQPFVSDNGNRILDCELGQSLDAMALQQQINCIPGVIENGLFLGLAQTVIIGLADGMTREM